MLSIEHVSLTYGPVAALRDVSLQLAKGEAAAVVGPSGAGKTSLLHVCNGLSEPTSGRVCIDDHDFTTASANERRTIRAGVGYIPQDLALVPELRVIQNVTNGAVGRRSALQSFRELLFPSRDTQRDVHTLLERVGIASKMFAITSTLSGGERQRVALARALYQRPRVLLADEPVSQVDPARARDVLDLILQLVAETQVAALVSLHHVDLACACFPRVIAMHGGRIISDGPPSELSPEKRTELYALSPAS